MFGDRSAAVPARLTGGADREVASGRAEVSTAPKVRGNPARAAPANRDALGRVELVASVGAGIIRELDHQQATDLSFDRGE